MANTNNNWQMKIMKFAGKVQNNLVVSSITQGMMSTMGVLMTGAVINILINLPISAWTTFLTNIGLQAPLAQIVTLLNMVGIFMVFGIGKTIAEKLGADGFQAGILSLMCYLIVTPLVTDEAGTNMVSVDLLGAQGVITAMIVGVLAGYLFAKLSKTQLKINMPDSVPPFVSASFENLPGLVLTSIPFIVLRMIFNATPFGSFTAAINTIVQVPLVSVGNSFAGQLVLVLICCLLWWLGMHGTLIIIPALYTVAYAPLIENITAVASGMPAPHLLSMMTVFFVVQAIGGPGCMLGLCVDMAFFTKSERYKAQGKLALVPGLFNVIEPMVYGTPVVLNFLLLIPMVLTPTVMFVLMYLGLKAGIFTTPLVLASSFLPGPIIGFLAGGGFMFGVFICLMCVLSCVIYYPFVKMLDNQELELEKAQETQE
ncbi:MAG: PTS sugar transporter subunit IIC [Erysipelotrichaceae bacterium]|nr:PTS sugar transporter subunit IIC [Erysipelotrichaceae bacterium]